MSTSELRKKFKGYYKAFDKAVEEHEKECERIYNEWLNRPSSYPPQPPPINPPTNYPLFPEECLGLRFEANTRAGTPCKLRSIYDNGRCKFHGGLSTGPKTSEGKKRSAMNGFNPKNKRSS